MSKIGPPNHAEMEGEGEDIGKAGRFAQRTRINCSVMDKNCSNLDISCIIYIGKSHKMSLVCFLLINTRD